MGLRPGRCYTRFQRPFTRQSIHVPRKGYVKGVPKAKITEFQLGRDKEYENRLYLVSTRNVQIRHNSLESARISAVQILEKNLGKLSDFFLKVRVFPHQVLRENSMATGAGADRFQQGMRQSFGKPVGTAARVKKGQTILEIRVNKAGLAVVKKALRQAQYKLPVPCRIVASEK